MQLTEKGYQIALRAHQNQIDKAGRPYIDHPMAVAATVETEFEKTAALLHDVVEDSEITLDDLRKEGFPAEVIEAVRLLTKPDGVDYFLYIDAIKQNPLARAVKLADLAHNMDLNRLPEITEKDKERIRKYEKARDYLLDKPYSHPRRWDNPIGNTGGHDESSE